MNTLLLILRVVHIACGVYWAGTIFFFTTFLQPSVKDLGPDGGKVMIRLFERGYLTVLPVIAVAAGREVSITRLPIGQTVTLVNTQPYARKIQVGAAGFESRRGLFDQAARRVWEAVKSWSSAICASCSLVKTPTTSRGPDEGVPEAV